MKKLLYLLLFFALPIHAQTFRVTIDPLLKEGPLDGRLLLLLSNNNGAEPRFQIGDNLQTQQVFGVDVEGWQPGTSRSVDVQAFGYPVERLKDIPAGDYYVQVLLHKYETFHLKTGQTVKLPMDRGEGPALEHCAGQYLFATGKDPYQPDGQ
jgi:hypothetical protein